jgi:hypothetical protein
MLTSSASHRLFLDDGGLISLFRLCRSIDAETLLNCSLIFRKLTPVSALIYIYICRDSESESK